MANTHPALVVLLLSGLVIFWLTPISAWLMLSGERQPNARWWFAGTAVYAMVATMFVFSSKLPSWLSGPVAAALSTSSLLLMLESLRRELSTRPPPWLTYFALLSLELAGCLWLQKQNLFSTMGAASHLLVLCAGELYMIWIANRVRKVHASKAMWLIILMLGVFCASNLSRVLELWLTGRFSSLLDFTVLASLGLMANYLGVVLYCYGYWGFVVEKNQTLLVKATEQAVQAREGEKLAQVSKLAQSGALSASIAHEVNQPLTAIQLNAEESLRIAQEAGAPEALLNLLTRIEQDNQRAAQIVRRIRAMFRQESPRYELQVLDELVELALALNKPRLDRENIALHLTLGAQEAFAFAGGEVEHILMNLLDNAMDSLRLLPSGSRELQICTWREHGYAYLSVADNGTGVSEERKPQLFELLQTSKQQGMGLGLWLSRYIVERHGGSIALDDRQTQGARFVVKLPMKKIS
jgi:C4-dicarboxylate-specific signal transduction histidine kinase